MMSHNAPGQRLVELCLRAYPAEFRLRFGDTIRADAADALTDARARGRPAWLRVLVVWCADAVLSGLSERVAMRRASGEAPRRPGPVLAAVGTDVRQALRRLRRAPGFSAVVVLTLALGTGLTATAFHVANATVFRPLDYPDPDRLVRISMVDGDGRSLSKVSGADVEDWAYRTRTFDSFTALDFGAVTFSDGTGDPEVVRATYATPAAFDVLRASAALGRLFRSSSVDDDAVVVSDALWRGRLGGLPSAIGKTILIEGRPRVVVGVLRPDFEDPAAAESGQSAVWLPLPFPDAGSRSSRWLSGIARLEAGVPLERAAADLAAVAAALAVEHPESNAGMTTRLEPLREAIWGDATLPLVLLVGAAGFVLLIACSNLANLLLARGAVRRREVAIRRAIGAGRGRIVRQLAVENAVLATIGGGAGLALTWLAAAGVRTALDGRLQRMAVAPGGAVVAVGVMLTLFAAVALGLLPGIHAARAQPGEILKETGRGPSSGRRARRMRNVLAGGQVAMALVLMVGAALLLRSFDRLMRVDPGFDPAGLLVWEISLPSATYADEASVVRFHGSLLDRLEAIPGARVGAVDKLPFGTRWGCAGFAVPGRPIPTRPEDWPCADSRSITSGYAEVMGLPLRRGRMLRDSDDASAERVVVVNETLAARTWPGSNPIGQRIAWSYDLSDETVWRTVVGVVGDVRHRGLDAPAQPEVYMPLEQAPDRRMSYVVRVVGDDPTVLADAVRAAVRATDAMLPVRDLRTFESTISDSLDGLRTGVLAVLGLGMLALILAVIGIYGVLAYFVAQRVPEIGLRVALGADSRSIARLVVGEGMRTAVVGAVIGLLIAVGVARLASSLLFGVRPTDPLSLGGVTLLLLGVAALASWLPARRALRVDPTTALRNE